MGGITSGRELERPKVARIAPYRIAEVAVGKSAKRKPAELAKGCLTVAQVVAVLKKLPQDKLVLPVVGWAGDSAFAEADAGIHVRTDEDGNVLIEGWLSNCGTELEIVEEEEGP